MMGVFGSTFGLRNSNSVLDFAGHQGESLLYVFAVFGRSFEEANVEMFGELLTFFEGDCALVLKITLVAD